MMMIINFFFNNNDDDPGFTRMILHGTPIEGADRSASAQKKHIFKMYEI
jgi:hypothetical protein